MIWKEGQPHRKFYHLWGYLELKSCSLNLKRGIYTTKYFRAITVTRPVRKLHDPEFDFLCSQESATFSKAWKTSSYSKTIPSQLVGFLMDPWIELRQTWLGSLPPKLSINKRSLISFPKYWTGFQPINKLRTYTLMRMKISFWPFQISDANIKLMVRLERAWEKNRALSLPEKNRMKTKSGWILFQPFGFRPYKR